MSSHHIVRDEQEPALIIHSISHEQWSMVLQLLEWSPVVIVEEAAIDFVLDHGHKIDVALVSFESANAWKIKLEAQQPVLIQACEPDGFMDYALDYLKLRNHGSVNVVTSNLDLFDQLGLLVNSKLDVVVFTEDQRHIVCRSLVFKKWLPAFSEMSLMPLEPSMLATTSGFDLNLDEEILSEGMAFTKKMEGEIVIQLSKTPALISEKL